MTIIRRDLVNGFPKSYTHTAETFNGYVMHLGALKDLGDKSREVFSLVTPALATIDVYPLLILDTPEVIYDPTKQTKDFSVAANDIGRATMPVAGDIYTLSVDCFTATPTVGEFVIPADGSLKLAPAAVIGNTKFVARVIEETTLDYAATQAFAIEVLRN